MDVVPRVPKLPRTLPAPTKGQQPSGWYLCPRSRHWQAGIRYLEGLHNWLPFGLEIDGEVTRARAGEAEDEVLVPDDGLGVARMNVEVVLLDAKLVEQREQAVMLGMIMGEGGG